jgi:dolichol kinase
MHFLYPIPSFRLFILLSSQLVHFLSPFGLCFSGGGQNILGERVVQRVEVEKRTEGSLSFIVFSFFFSFYCLRFLLPVNSLALLTVYILLKNMNKET